MLTNVFLHICKNPSSTSKRAVPSLCGFVLFKSTHLSLTRSKEPDWPPALAHAHTPLNTGWLDYRAREKTSAAEAQLHPDVGILPRLGQDCELVVTIVLRRR